MSLQTAPQPATADQVLTKAVVRAAALLGLPQQTLAAILHVSPATVSRIVNGRAVLGVDSAEGQFARLFLRVFRSLDTLVGGHPEKAKAWLEAGNTHLRGVPLERIQKAEGLFHVAEYLDAVRGTL